MDGVAHLASVIAAHLREWDPSPPFVELAVFGTHDANEIADLIDSFCSHVLGAGVAYGVFHQSSIGSVTGVALDDGRRVVIKLHQPQRSRELLAEIARIQNHLAEIGLFAPKVVAGPLALGHGHAIVEPFIDAGTTANARQPEVCRALAHGLRRIVTACEAFVPSTSLGPGLLSAREAPLWPTPHSKLFDFGATSLGAEWIDEIAVRAREQMRPAGVYVIGHNDWRQEHVRFLGGDPVWAFDWDSLCCDLEPALIGSVAHGFTSDWSRNDQRQAPTRKEALRFISDYEEARLARFSFEERRLAHASLVYACAYTARCGHALGRDDREAIGTFQHLLWTEGATLLAT
jgi:hypothetical protein